MASKLPTARGFPSLQEIRANPNPLRIEAKRRKNLAKKKSQTILALDMSTTAIGWAIGEEPRIVNFGKIVLTKDRELAEKLLALKEFIEALIKTYKPTALYIERPLARRGNVTASHNQVLGVVRLIALEAGIMVEDKHLVSPRTVKTKLGVKPGDDHDHNKKIMVDYVNKTLGLRLKYHKDSALQSDDDIADAIAILLALWTR